MSIESIFGERELKVLREMMTQKDMSAEAVVRHMFRMGQMMDHYLSQNIELGFLDDQGDFNSIFHVGGAKMAPVPDDLSRWLGEGGAQPKQLSCGCDVGTCICNFEKD